MQEKFLLLPSAKSAVLIDTNQPRYARPVRLVALGLGLVCILVGAADLSSRLARATFGEDANLLAFAPAIALEEHTVAATSTAGAIVPARLKVPSLGIDAAVEQVGLKGDGSMGTPQDFDDVAWYAPGGKPGAEGNTVFAGHVNNGRTTAGVFTHLSKLKAGDYITVADAARRSVVYRVSDIAKYPADEAPPAELFTTDGPSKLVLITCEGDWVPAERTFSNRLVVFAKPAY